MKDERIKQYKMDQREKPRTGKKKKNPGRGNGLSFLKKVQTGSGPTQLSFFPGLKRRGRYFDHSPASSAEVKNEWCCTSTPYIPSWHGQG
jgi:hypothetical protein